MSDENNNNSSQAKKKGLSKTQVILIIGIVVILSAIGVIGAVLYQLLQKESATPLVEADRRNYVVDESNLEDIQAERAVAVADNMFRLKMNTSWNFSSATEPSEDAYVANSGSNKKPFFFEVSLADTDEVIYTSGIIPVGSAIKRITLDKSLEAGTYKAVCKYNMLNEDEEISSSFSVNIDISIKK